MKKIILIFLLALFYVNSNAQCTQPYKPLSAYAKDTVAFMTYNFTTRADCYKGKTVKDVITDLQISVKDFSVRKPIQPNPTEVYGITLYIYTWTYTFTRVVEKKYFNKIYVEFESPITHNTYTKKEYKGWTTDLYNYFKDLKVKRVAYLDRLKELPAK